jgi:GNAT superfamily N-acetyltransferase
MGRPKLTVSSKDRRTQITLESHPEWLTFEDLQVLLRQYRGKGYGRKLWNTLVATGKIPGYQDPWGNQLRYRWAEVRTAIDGAMKRVG